MASLAACSTWRRRLGEGEQWVKGAQAGWKAGRRLESLPHIGHDMEGTEDTQKSKPQRTRRTRRKTNHGGHGHGKRGGRTRWAASTRRGGLRWSAQSCGPRHQSWWRMAIGTPVAFGMVLLCRRDRRHGKPGGMLHFAAAASGGARSRACHAASLGGGWRSTSVPFGIVWLCRRDRRHGKPGGMLHFAAAG